MITKKLTLILCCLVLSNCAFSKISLFISTDIGSGTYTKSGKPADIDDTFAIIGGLNSKDIQVNGIAAQFGNNTAHETFKALQKLMTFFPNKQIPIVEGAVKAIKDQQNVPITAGARLLAKVAKQQKIVVLAIAPLTDIASFITHYPKLKKNIQLIVMEMGSFSDKPFIVNKATAHDFNYLEDPIATQIVLESKIPIVTVGFNAMKNVYVTQTTLKKWAINSPKPYSKWLYQSSVPRMQAYYKEGWNNVPGFFPWDYVTFYYLINPKIFQCVPAIQANKNPKILVLQKVTNSNTQFCYKLLPGGIKKIKQSIWKLDMQM